MTAFPRSTIATFAVLETATDFVPLPFVGDLLARKLHRRLVETIGMHHGVELTADQAESFTGELPAGVASRIARRGKAVFVAPFRTAFAGIFAVVGADAVADAVGKRYARGLAVDVALDEGLVSRDGAPRTAEKVLAAVERVETRPTRRLLALGFRAFERSMPDAAARISGALDHVRARAPFLASDKLPVTSDEREELRTALVGTRARSESRVLDESFVAAPATA
jgi:uncharacterized protein (DUF697 family)